MPPFQITVFPYPCLKNGFGNHPSPPEQTVEFSMGQVAREGVKMWKPIVRHEVLHRVCTYSGSLELREWAAVLPPSSLFLTCAAFPMVLAVSVGLFLCLCGTSHLMGRSILLLGNSTPCRSLPHRPLGEEEE